MTKFVRISMIADRSIIGRLMLMASCGQIIEPSLDFEPVTAADEKAAARYLYENHLDNPDANGGAMPTDKAIPQAAKAKRGRPRPKKRKGGRPKQALPDRIVATVRKLQKGPDGAALDAIKKVVKNTGLSPAITDLIKSKKLVRTKQSHYKVA